MTLLKAAPDSNRFMPPLQRLSYIDVLRGLAALLVVYQHASLVTLNPALHIDGLEQSVIEFFRDVISIGEVGVCIFFMISGFVVPFSLLKYERNPIRNFAAHRFFRLYPTYWFSVPLGLVFVYWRFGVQYGGQQISWATFFANLSMVQTFFGFDDIMGQYWTLALELVFYLLCAVLFLGRRLDSFKAMMVILLAVVVGREIGRHYWGIDTEFFRLSTMFRFLDFMFFGLLYRKWLLEDDKQAGWQAILVLIFALVTYGGPTVIRKFIGGDHLALKPQLTYLTAVAIFVLCTRVHQPTNRIGAYLGKISYSIYLFHPVVFYPLFIYWFPYSPAHSYPHVFIAATMALTVLASTLTYRYIEKPFIAMGSKFFSSDRTVEALQGGRRGDSAIRSAG